MDRFRQLREEERLLEDALGMEVYHDSEPELEFEVLIIDEVKGRGWSCAFAGRCGAALREDNDRAPDPLEMMRIDSIGVEEMLGRAIAETGQGKPLRAQLLIELGVHQPLPQQTTDSRQQIRA